MTGHAADMIEVGSRHCSRLIRISEITELEFCNGVGGGSVEEAWDKASLSIKVSHSEIWGTTISGPRAAAAYEYLCERLGVVMLGAPRKGNEVSHDRMD